MFFLYKYGTNAAIIVLSQFSEKLQDPKLANIYPPFIRHIRHLSAIL